VTGQVSTIVLAPGFVASTSGNGTSVVRAWPNGTYTFTATADLTNYTSAQGSSTFSMTGNAAFVSVQFCP
jgi:hypothetical protein